MTARRTDAQLARATVEAVCAVIFFLRKKERSAGELVHVTGLPHDSVNRILEALCDEGMACCEGPDFQGEFTYRWA